MESPKIVCAEPVVRSVGSPAAGTAIRSGRQLREEGAGAEEGSHPEKGVLRWGRNMASPREETLGTWRYGRWKTRDLQAMHLCKKKKQFFYCTFPQVTSRNE